MFPKDSQEYQLLLRYTQKKTHTNSYLPQSNGVVEAKVASPMQPQDGRKPRKLKKHRLSKVLSCIRPVKEDDGPAARHHRQPAAAGSCERQNATLLWITNAMTMPCLVLGLQLFTRGVALVGQEVMKHVNHVSNRNYIWNRVFLFTPAGPNPEVEQIVNKLIKITDSVHFQSTEIETDSDGGYFWSGLLSSTSFTKRKLKQDCYHVSGAKVIHTGLVLKHLHVLGSLILIFYLQML